MNLLFRFILVLLQAALGSTHTPLTAPRRAKFTVWLTDQDMFLHMTNSRYLSFADLGRVDLSARTGLRRVMNRQGWRAEICGQITTINRMLKAPNRFELETQIRGWDDQYIAVSQIFVRRGKTHASVNTLLMVQDKNGGLISPQNLIDAVAPGMASPKLSDLFTDLITQTNANISNTSLSQPPPQSENK